MDHLLQKVLGVQAASLAGSGNFANQQIGRSGVHSRHRWAFDPGEKFLLVAVSDVLGVTTDMAPIGRKNARDPNETWPKGFCRGAQSVEIDRGCSFHCVRSKNSRAFDSTNMGLPIIQSIASPCPAKWLAPARHAPRGLLQCSSGLHEKGVAALATVASSPGR
jgi:hypothetical protein